jgi:sugar phosphate isomerase/epimerase
MRKPWRCAGKVSNDLKENTLTLFPMKPSRRTFLKSAAALAACSALRAEAHPLHLPIGLQLYSVRNLLPKDFDGTLAQVRSAGYTVVEAAGYFNRSAKDFRQSMDKAGLRCVSTHHTLKQLLTEFDEWSDYARTLGLEYIVCSSSGGMHRDPAATGAPTLDDWRWIAGQFNQVGEKVKAAGMTFGVHNHTPEFATIDGTLVYDELLRLTDPKYVVFEMDSGWVAASGHDQVAYLRRDPQRFPLMHVKDMIKGPNGQMHATEMGRGDIHYTPILRAATGLKYYFIEQEEFDIDPIQALRIDAQYMRKLNV